MIDCPTKLHNHISKILDIFCRYNMPKILPKRWPNLKCEQTKGLESQE